MRAKGQDIVGIEFTGFCNSVSLRISIAAHLCFIPLFSKNLCICNTIGLGQQSCCQKISAHSLQNKQNIGGDSGRNFYHFSFHRLFLLVFHGDTC